MERYKQWENVMTRNVMTLYNISADKSFYHILVTEILLFLLLYQFKNIKHYIHTLACVLCYFSYVT